jgi:hypothetical protein
MYRAVDLSSRSHMDRNMDFQHGHEAWTWTYTIDMEMDKYHECRNAVMQIKSLDRHS